MTAPASCFLCGSNQVSCLPYINARALGPVRSLAYRLPGSAVRALSRVSPGFGRSYRSIATNRKYFDVDLCYCDACGTGSVHPPFAEARLSQYYAEYYWTNRDVADGQHRTVAHRPNDRQLALSQSRIAWFERWLPEFAAVIDFGAGDCSAGYALRDRAQVVAVDPSAKTAMIAAEIGIESRKTLGECPQVDLLYASHSLEHVHDLLDVFGVMLDRVRSGGHLFFEVPNVSSREVFEKLYHSPHTYALCRQSFVELAARFDCEIVAMEDVGQPWQVRGQTFADRSNADLRVLLRR